MDTIVKRTADWIPRVHWIELHDQSWFPASARDVVTQLILTVWRAFPPRSAAVCAAEVLGQVLKDARSHRVIDCCSGSGGPVLDYARHLRQIDPDEPVSFVLSDLYPNVEVFRQFKSTGLNIDYIERPVDATNLPKDVISRGHGHGLTFRMFNASFHHFDRPGAVGILRDCVVKRTGVAIFEPPERNIFAILAILAAPLTLPLTMLMIQILTLTQIRRWFGLTWNHVLWVFLIPIVPFTFWFDSLMSCMRAYSPREMQAMIREADPGGSMHWEIGRKAVLGPIFGVNYVIGYPKRLSGK